MHSGGGSYSVFSMNIGIDPWDVESPEDIVNFNVEFFFNLFPEVDRSNESLAKECIQSVVEDALSFPIQSATNNPKKQVFKRPQEMSDEIFVKHARKFLAAFPGIPNDEPNRDELEMLIRDIWHEASHYQHTQRLKKSPNWGREFPPKREDK